MKLRWWHVIGLLFIGAVCNQPIMNAIAILTIISSVYWPITLIAIVVGIYLAIRSRRAKTNAQSEVEKINSEMDETERILDELSQISQTDGKVTPIWGLPHKKQ